MLLTECLDIFPYVLFNNNETYKFLYYPNNGLYLMYGAYIINNNYTKNFRPETINLIKDVTLKKILIYGFLKLLLIERSIYQYFISLVLYNIFLDWLSLYRFYR